MTDENTNDRSDRAERLRRMREQRTSTSSEVDPTDEPDASTSETTTTDSDDERDESTKRDDNTDDGDEGTEPARANTADATDTNEDESANDASPEDERSVDTDDDGDDEHVDSDEDDEHVDSDEDDEHVDSDEDDEHVDGAGGDNESGDSGEERGEDVESDGEHVDDDGGGGGGGGGDEEESEQQSYQLIEFELGDDRYGIDITRADEVLAYREVTRVPNTPELIRGVVDIRGQIITVIDPTTVFNPRGTADGDGLIVVFEVELVDGAELIGWAVDNVLSVHTVEEEEIVEPPAGDETVEAALEREDGYLTLTTPESLLAATGEFGTKLSDAAESEIAANG